MTPTILLHPYAAPCGAMTLGSYRDALCLCDWTSEKRRDTIGRRLRNVLHAEFEEGTSPVILRAAMQLDEYFTGRRATFDVPLLFAGTEFQKLVWNALLAVPYGQTASYAQIADRIGHPTAVRAVANANGANALSLFVPCHRIVGSDHSLTGYAGGLHAKEFLLRLEKSRQK